mmetsp:Transcript_13859/g.15968  ORF Transcript_13859/g.15968 Transcript_13859/m.15968 type:complete len:135 (-) Transcript_13859:14-418(-)
MPSRRWSALCPLRVVSRRPSASSRYPAMGQGGSSFQSKAAEGGGLSTTWDPTAGCWTCVESATHEEVDDEEEEENHFFRCRQAPCVTPSPMLLDVELKPDLAPSSPLSKEGAGGMSRCDAVETAVDRFTPGLVV